MATKTKADSGNAPKKNNILILGVIFLIFIAAVYIYASSMANEGPVEFADKPVMNNNDNGSIESTVPQDNTSDVEVTPNEPSINQSTSNRNENIGTLSIVSNPTGAAVFVDTIAHGSTPLTYNLSVGNHFLDLKKPGYQTYKAQVLINAGKVAYLNATLTQTVPSNTTPNNSVQTGTLSIYSNPAKATVLIDNETIGTNVQTPVVYSNITEGYHTLSFEKSGYVPYSMHAYVASGILTLIEANLTAMDAQFGTLNITTSPEQSEFYLDNTLIGTTPVVFNATVDYHFVRLEKEGYISYNKRVYTNANKVIDMNVTLIAKSGS